MMTPAKIAVARTRLPPRITIRRKESSPALLGVGLGAGVADSAQAGTKRANQLELKTTSVISVIAAR